MNIQCSHCSRSFNIDDKRIAHLNQAACLCGRVLQLKSDGSMKQQLGKYILIHRIATGGMGEVYYGKSSSIEGFEKEVAIKKMLPHLSADKTFINMMIKEAKMTVLLNHPNIVGIYDLDKDGNEYYIAMEYVPGITLSKLLEESRRNNALLPCYVVVHIALNILKGLAYAHDLTTPSGQDAAIIHRDITPQNILITLKGFVKITDFGIARAVNEISTTSPGMLKGKLGYIAPEQLQGRDVDRRLDLFCVGILMWEMLTTKRLFKGATETETIHLVSKCDIPTFDAIRADVPSSLQEVIFKALRPDPNDRFASANDFYHALLQAIAPETPDSMARAAEDFLKNHATFFAGIFNPHTEADLLGEIQNFSELIPVDRLLQKSPYRYIWFVACICVVIASALVWWKLSNNPPATPPPAPHVQEAAPVAAPLSPPAPAIAPPPLPPHPASKVTSPSTPHRAALDPLRKKPLSSEEIQAGVRHYYNTIARCVRKIKKNTAPAQLKASIAIAPKGNITAADIDPKWGDTVTEKCLIKSLKAMHFRPHSGGEIKVTIPLQIEVKE